MENSNYAKIVATPKPIRLTQTDRAVFHSIETVVEGIALGNSCEVVLHSLEDTSRSVIKIVNGHVTGREIGSPIADFAIDLLKKADSLSKDVIGSYYTRLDDNRLLKSVTMIIRNNQRKPIGLLCINIDISVPVKDFLEAFLKIGEGNQDVVEHFPLTVKELISQTMETVLTEVNKQREISPSEKSKMVILQLNKRGIFNVKGAVDLVARELGISRYTVYNCLRENKTKD